MSDMSYTPTAGETCQVLIPVAPGTDGEKLLEVGKAAHEALERLCAEHDMRPTDIRSVFHGTIAEAQTAHVKLNLDDEVMAALGEDWFVAIFEATAA